MRQGGRDVCEKLYNIKRVKTSVNARWKASTYITVTGLCVHFSYSKAHSTTTIG